MEGDGGNLIRRRLESKRGWEENSSERVSSLTARGLASMASCVRESM